jgi:hypothetical protein
LIWRLWKEQNVPLHELKHQWTYEELVQANAVLDMHQSIEIAWESLMEEKLKTSGGK